MAAGATLVHQGILIKHLDSIFPNVDKYENAKKRSNLRYSNGSYLELDVWIPKHKISFEFQDTYHYEVTWYSQVTRNDRLMKDKEKISKTQQEGITLIVVPCWWDGTIESLVATIRFARPDLILPLITKAIPISFNPVPDFFRYRDVPGVGELMLASFTNDLKFTLSSEDYDTWWMGEKYDGIRCCWNPVNEEVYSRGGNVLPVLDSVKQNLPDLFMDCEFWFGRGNYSLTYPLYKGLEELVYWQTLKMIAFDVPNTVFHFHCFEDRYEKLLQQITEDHAVAVAPRILCNDQKHLRDTVEAIIDNTGEGAILRKRGSIYEHGRSTSLLKMKTALGDREGIVIGISENNSVRLKLPNGRTFYVPEANVHIPIPAIGDVVTFSYEASLHRDEPTNAIICRIRTDVDWTDLVKDHFVDKQYLSHHSKVAGISSEQHPRIKKIPSNQSLKDDKDWYDVRQRRKFFEKFAKTNAFDPLVASNWYLQQSLRQRLNNTKGAFSVLSYHKGSLSRALMDLFPNIGFEKTKLRKTSTFWDKRQNRRQFFINYAKENEFDPLVADNWYSQSSESILSTEKIWRVILRHKKSVSQALLDLFPNIGLKKDKLWFGSWNEFGSVEQILYNSPLINVPKSGPRINQNGFEVANFWDRRTWHDIKMRKLFFENFAKLNHFDPLVASNWYSQSKDKILSTRGSAYVLFHHKNKISRALMELFPNIGLVKSEFQVGLRQ